MHMDTSPVGFWYQHRLTGIGQGSISIHICSNLCLMGCEDPGRVSWCRFPCACIKHSMQFTIQLPQLGTEEVQICIGTIQLLQLGTGVVQIHTCTMSIAAIPLLMDIVIGTAAIMPHLTLPLFDAALRF